MAQGEAAPSQAAIAQLERDLAQRQGKASRLRAELDRSQAELARSKATLLHQRDIVRDDHHCREVEMSALCAELSAELSALRQREGKLAKRCIQLDGAQHS